MTGGFDPQGIVLPSEPTILHSEAGVVAVAKPAGIPTQAPRGVPSVEEWLRSRLAPGAYLGVPHRLDRAVSGVLLMAVTPRAARKLSRQFERRQIVKRYLALLAADAENTMLASGEQTWRDVLLKVPEEPRARIATVTESGAREAVTTVRLVGRLSCGTVVEMQPLTGRMHQLRVQASSRGMPIVGDTMYGGQPLSTESVPVPGARQLPIALHAWRIAYSDPDAGHAIEIESPLPTFWPADVRRLVAQPS